MKTYKIPEDILRELKHEFPDIPNIDAVISGLFEKIFRKAILDGSCAIAKLGTFFTYKTYSNRTNKVMPRFKFIASRSMRDSILMDPYIMERIHERESNSDSRRDIYTDEKVRQGGEKNRQTRQSNEASRSIARKKTKERVVQDEISAILEEKFNE